MYDVEIYAQVRRFCIADGNSNRHAARFFGLSRATIRKILTYSEPPGYRRQEPVSRPVLGPYIGVVGHILEADKAMPRKQRHTAKRIYERLRDEHGYPGKYGSVKEYVRELQQVSREMFIPLHHPPGHGQADFGEALAVIGGVEMKIHYFCAEAPHSDDMFVKAYPGETTEAFLDGHNAAFSYFGGVPRSMLYDNTKLAVARITGDGTRQQTRAFTALRSHYLFEPRFGRPGKGNDKGKVEGLVGYARRNFLVPIPRSGSFDSLNKQLEEQCRQRRDRRLRGHKDTVAVRLERDLQAFLPLPSPAFDACDKIATRVSSLSLVRYKNNDYSVPVAFGHRDVVVKGYVDQVVIIHGAQVIASHERSWKKEDFVYDPLHYLPLLERKIGALDQAAPLQGWQLPDTFSTLRRLMEARLGKKGKREYVQVLRLLETFTMEQVTNAVAESIRLNAISIDAVKHLLLCAVERKAPRLDLANWPHLPKASVKTTRASDYASLVSS